MLEEGPEELEDELKLPAPELLSSAPVTGTAPTTKFTVTWNTEGIDRIQQLINYLMSHCTDYCIFFSKNKKKNQILHDDDSKEPSSKDKGDIYAVIAYNIFSKDVTYDAHYQLYSDKFVVAISNHINK